MKKFKLTMKNRQPRKEQVNKRLPLRIVPGFQLSVVGFSFCIERGPAGPAISFEGQE
jgi:hypothetical protein